MKKTQTWLALLLAGMIASGALLACSRNDAFVIDEDERERAEQLSKEFDYTQKTTKPSEKPDKSEQSAPLTTPNAVTTEPPDANGAPITEMLTPAQLYRELDERESSYIEMIYRAADGEYETIVLTKHGDLLEIDMGYESGAQSVVSYYDFVKSIEYYEEEGAWQVMPINPVGMTWSSLLVSLNETLGSVFDAGSDLFYALDEPNKVAMKADALETYGYGYLSFAFDPESKTHTLFMQDLALAESVSITVDLTRTTSVILPEVSGEGSGSNDQSLYVNLTPSELFAALSEAEEVGITISGDEVHTVYEKDGVRAYLYSGTSATDGLAIYADLQSGLTFAQLDDGNWAADYLDEPITWKGLLDELLLTEQAYFFRDLNYGSFGEDDRVLSVDPRLLEGTNIAAFELERDGLIYRLTETYRSGEKVVTVLRFDQVTVNFPGT